jgi:hypothetical protein
MWKRIEHACALLLAVAGAPAGAEPFLPVASAGAQHRVRYIFL